MQTLLPTKKYISLKNILFLLLLFFIYFCLFHAGIKQEIYPFAIGFYIAIIWCNKNRLLNFILFSICSICSSLNLLFFLTCCIFSFSLLGVITILKKKNKKLNFTNYTLICCFLLLIYLPYYINNNTPYLNIFYTFLLSVIFYLSICKCIKTFLTKNANLKFNLDEIICICFILFTLGMGLGEITLCSTSLIKPFGIFLIFLLTLLLTNNSSVVFGASLGIGYALNFGDLNYIAIFTCFSIVSFIFKNNKYYLALSLTLTEILLGLYFAVYNSYSIVNFLFALIPIIIVLIIPQKTINTVKEFLSANSYIKPTRNLIERNKKNLSNKFLEISNAFFEIGVSFKNSIKTKLPKTEAKELIKQELIKQVCINCKNKDRCLTLLKEHILADFDCIIDTGFQKEKLSILDIPAFLNSHCFNLNLLISATNNLLKSYNNFLSDLEEKNSGKLLLLDEIEALNKMFLNLSKTSQENTVYDISTETQLQEELNFNNIHVKDVVLIVNSNKTMELSLIIHEKDIENPLLLKTINKTLKRKMEIVNIQKSNLDKYDILTFKETCKYNCIYGVSSNNKYLNNVSGDNFSCVKLDQNKVLFAICDGMGNGEIAKAHSEHTINLIENFYKAGFPYENIIQIVNKLISLDSEDVFSALDISLIDLNTGKTDFIKLGSQESFIKENSSVQIITGNSLPMGIVKDIKPSISSRIITIENMVFMCSDGVIDCIGYDNLLSYLERTTTKNPQSLCDEIISLALKSTDNKPKDDITALAFKLFIN